MITINLMPESIIVQKRGRYRANLLFAMMILLGAAGAVVACAGYIAQRIGGSETEMRLALSNQIALLREKIVSGKKDLEYQKLQAQQNNSWRLNKIWVSQQLIDIAGAIPQHTTLSALRIAPGQIALSGVASKRSDVGELVSALRLQSQTRDISVEILKDITIGGLMLQEFVIRGSESR